MQLPLKRIQCVDFHEHPISHPKHVKVELFEIYSKEMNLPLKYRVAPMPPKNQTPPSLSSKMLEYEEKGTPSSGE